MSAELSDSQPYASRRRAFVEGLGVRVVLCGFFSLILLALGLTGNVARWPGFAAATILLLLVVVNVPYWLIGKRAGFPLSHFFVHRVLDILILTFFVHFIGGIDAPYCGLAYVVLVLFSAVNESRAVSMRLAGLAVVSFALLVTAETSGLVPRVEGMWEHQFTTTARAFSFVTVVIFIFALAWVAGTLADKLRAANANLVDFSARIEEQNRTLERRVAERTAELARATQEIQDLVHIITHDLKNVAVASTETARKLVKNETDRLSERGKGYAAHLLEDARSMSRMLQDLLTLFRETDSQVTRSEWVDVGEVVERVLQRLQYQIEAKTIQVVVGPLPSVYAEEGKVRHVFDNLIDNACKYVGENRPPRIEIGGSSSENDVTFFVQDNGVGLDERQVARIFQLYHRSPKQEVAGVTQQGHGVGLAIVKRIVERYGGTITVESTLHRGATFRVTLPRDGAAYEADA